MVSILSQKTSNKLINPFCTQNRNVHSLLKTRIAVFTKDVQLYLISFYLTFIIEIHCSNFEKHIQSYYVLFDV